MVTENNQSTSAPKPPDHNHRIPSLAEVEEVLGIPATDWVGHGHAVAPAIVAAGLVDGHVVYGDWRGDISENGRFRHAIGRPIVHHGWIALDDGRILDPTRWAFEGKPPFLYVGPPGNDYDEGGNLHRWATMQPPPTYRAEDIVVPATRMSLFGHLAMLDLLGNPSSITVPMLVWIANLPVELLGDLAATVYADIVTVGHEALIPVDNLMMVARKLKAQLEGASR
jgi:hypothetical protein